MDAADMNGDGEIDNIDSFKVNQIIKENENNVKTLQGDSDGNGVVDENDYKNIDNYLSGKSFDKDFIRKNSDINGDGMVDEQDLKGMRNILNGRPADWDESRLGDANGDGKINEKDLELLRLRSVGLGQNLKFNMNYADFDNDGEITGVDILKLSKLVEKYENSVKTIQGDSNGDGKVNEADYKNINNYLSGKESGEDFVKKNSDINGDGVVDKKDLQGVRNILDGRKIDWDESKRRLGDVNGDGKVDMNDAVTVQNYTENKIQKNDFYWDNADVNHDGKIDLEDAMRIQKFYNGEISSLDQKITKVNPPFEKAVITADTDVYSDFFFMKKNNNVIKGDIVRVIGKSSDGTAFEIAFPNTEGGESTGWVSVNSLEKYESPPDPITVVDPPFTLGKAKYKAEVYADYNLNSKVNADEKIFAEEQVRVTGMSSDGKALRIVYSSIYGGEKERWVSADAIEKYEQSVVPQKLQDLVNYWTGIGKWTNGYSRSKSAEKHLNSSATHCKEFAAYIFNILYDTGYVGSGSVSSNYYNWRLNNIPSSIYQVAEVPQSTGLTSSNAKDLFSQAKSGDFIQMKRGHGGAHSAILTKKNDDGVWFLEANADGKNTIQEKFYSWNDLVKITSKGNKYNVAMSIYRKK